MEESLFPQRRSKFSWRIRISNGKASARSSFRKRCIRPGTREEIHACKWKEIENSHSTASHRILLRRNVAHHPDSGEGSVTTEPQNSGPRVQKFSITRRQYDQAWVWSPRLNEWLLVYDCKQVWPELNDLPSIGIKKPDPLPSTIERAPSPKLDAERITENYNDSLEDIDRFNHQSGGGHW